MQGLRAFNFLSAAAVVILSIGGCPQPAPETAVLGEQEIAEDPSTPIGEDNTLTTDQPPSISNITVTAELVQGQSSMIALSCMASDSDGMVQSVMADLSAVGGPSAQPMSVYGTLWTWSGLVTPTVTGPQTIAFTATDQSGLTRTAPTIVQVATASQPAEPPLPPPPSDGQTTPSGQPGENIARGRPYTWNVAPDYPYCIDPGDATQLTDGRYTKGSCFWTQTSTVGWRHKRLVQITVDLGHVQPIMGLSFSTAGDASGAEWPLVINLLVSDDGVNYYHACELTSLSSEHGLPMYSTYAVHSYWTKRLATHARFARVCVASNAFVFADEIEVYRGSNSMLAAPFQGDPITDMATYMQTSQVGCGIVRRILLDAQDVQSQVQAASRIDSTVQTQLASQISTIIDQARHLGGQALYWPEVSQSTFRAILPLNDLHSQVFHVLAALWRVQGQPGLAAWQTRSLWDRMNVTQAPGTTPPNISVTMMRNEYRAASFELSNATDADLTLTVNVLGLPGGTNPSYVTVHEVAWTDTSSGLPVAAALPDATRGNNGFLVHIPSGMTRQVWMTFHPTPAAVPAATYDGTIVIDGSAASTVTIPLHLRLSSVTFPAQPTLSVGGWDYTDCYIYGVKPGNRSALVTHLREHFVDTPWATSQVMPNPVNFAHFDAWVQRWTGARNYRIFLNVGTTFEGLAMGTPGFDKAVGRWISAYATHWRQIGLDPRQIRLLLVDEPQTPEQSGRVIAWANAIHKVEPNIKIWEEPAYTTPSEGNSMFAACDVLCLHRPYFLTYGEAYRDVYRHQRDAGKTLDFYSACGPARLYDPYSYYRLQAWTCWNEGATAMHFWAFGDNGNASSWNEYLTDGSYTPLFLDDASVTAGKQMEAIREGAEDYEYLVMLKSRIAQLTAAGNTTPALSAAKSLLSEAAGRVLNASGASQPLWSDAKDRNISDQVRIEILNMLEVLGPPDALYAP